MFSSEGQDGRPIRPTDMNEGYSSLPARVNAMAARSAAMARQMGRMPLPPGDDTNNRTFWARIYGNYEQAGTGTGYQFRVVLFDADGKPFYESSDTIWDHLEDLNGNQSLVAGEYVEVQRVDGGDGQSMFKLKPMAPGGGLIPVLVTMVDGSAGTVSTICTFTYSYTDTEYAVLVNAAHKQSPLWNRPAKGKMIVATHGTAYRNLTTGAWALWQVDEQPDKQPCVIP